MLLQIRNIMMREKIATAQQLGRMLAVECSALEPMLCLLVNKGILALSKPASCASHCGGCNKTRHQTYTYCGQ